MAGSGDLSSKLRVAVIDASPLHDDIEIKPVGDACTCGGAGPYAANADRNCRGRPRAFVSAP